MRKDITEIAKMLLIILLWIGAYSLSLELIKAYANHSRDCKIETPDSTMAGAETLYAHINARRVR